MNSAINFVHDSPPARSIAPAFDLTVRVGDGVRGLGRVINVLALLDITPLDLSAVEREDGLEVRARICAEGATARLGLQRMRALPCVRSALLAARNVQAAPYLTAVC